MEDLKLLVRVMTCLFVINLSGCSRGWSIGGIQISPQDTIKNIAFVEITSNDSIQHWYSNAIYDEDNWCYLHDEWEYVEVQ